MPHTSAGIKSWENATLVALKDPYTRVLKVTDESTSEIISSGRWILPRKEEDGGGHQPGEEKDRWGDLPEQCDEELVKALFGAFAKNMSGFMEDRRHYCAFHLLSHSPWTAFDADTNTDMELLGTVGEYKGQGAGSMILKYGCDLADQDGLEAYIDFSPAGKPLYERFGWVFTKETKLPRFEYSYHFGIRQPKEKK